jgi:hypothetical protein
MAREEKTPELGSPGVSVGTDALLSKADYFRVVIEITPLKLWLPYFAFASETR